MFTHFVRLFSAFSFVCSYSYAYACIGSAGSLFVFGGEYTPSSQGHEGAGLFHSDSYVYDIALQQWKQVDVSSNRLLSIAYVICCSCGRGCC